MPFKRLDEWLKRTAKNPAGEAPQPQKTPEPKPVSPQQPSPPLPASSALQAGGSQQKQHPRGRRGGRGRYPNSSSGPISGPNASAPARPGQLSAGPNPKRGGAPHKRAERGAASATPVKLIGKTLSYSAKMRALMQSAPRTEMQDVSPHHGHTESVRQLIKDFSASKEPKLRICPIGGFEQVGGNMMFLEYGDDIVIIDGGMEFADDELLGVDYSIPDVTYLEERKSHIRGWFITHGHLDHIGAIPHILPKIGNPPIYATKLTLGLTEKRLEEFALDKGAKLIPIDPAKDVIKLGNFEVDFFRVNHSIPDGVGIRFKTPCGSVIHTSDFKFDFDPADGLPCDIAKMVQIGDEGVLALMSDSTNAHKKGFTKSERVVGETLREVIRDAKGRIIIASFSSLIGRIQQILEFAKLYDRKIFVAGRSLLANLEVATKTGHIRFPKENIRKLSADINQYPDHEVLILTTGSQGEAMAALSRIALGDHQNLTIKPGDTVCFSSSPIIGNERAVATVIDNLTRTGAKVITNNALDVHTSGHGYQGDLMLMYHLMRPKYYIPIHGQYHMRFGHKEMIHTGCGHPENLIEMLTNGDILEFDHERNARKSKTKLPLREIFVDGLGVGDIGTAVLRERKTMSDSGIVVIMFRAYAKSKHLVADPDVMSRGFIYLKASESIAQEIRDVAKAAYLHALEKNPQIDLHDLKYSVQGEVELFIHRRIERQPLVMPIVMWV